MSGENNDQTVVAPEGTPKEKKLDSFSKHANLFQSLFAGHSSLHSTVSTISARNPRELEKTQEELRGKYSRIEKENLEKIWDEFDENKDGQLSKDENEALVREYFNNMAKWFPKMMDELLTSSLGFLDKSGQSGPAFEKMSETMQPLYNELFESVQKDVPQMADEMWTLMDINHDGKVVKDEFLVSFDECSNDIVSRITRRVLYCIFANGNIDFAQFITDVDKETPNSDDQPPDADAIELEHQLKGKFNEAVRDTAREELQRTTEPCSTDEFWHKVCTRIRGWLGALNNNDTQRNLLGGAGGVPPQPFGASPFAPYGMGPTMFNQFGAFGQPFGQQQFGQQFGMGPQFRQFPQFGQFGVQQQQQQGTTPATGVTADQASQSLVSPTQLSQFTPQLYAQMQQTIQLQQAQLQQAQATARAAEAQAQAAASIAAQAQIQAQTALAAVPQQAPQPTPKDVTSATGDKATPAGEGLSPAAAAHFAATQQATLPAGAPTTLPTTTFGVPGVSAYQPFGQPYGASTYGVPPPFPSFGGSYGGFGF